MYLSKLVLNARDYWVRRDLANCQELHRTLLSAFDAEHGSRVETGLLFRIDEGPRSAPVVIAQSTARPDWQRLLSRSPQYLVDSSSQGWQCKEVGEAYRLLRPGSVLRFRLRANPTKRLGKSAEGTQPAKVGKRVALLREEQRIAWLERKAEAGGFRLRTIQSSESRVAATDVRPEADLTGWRTHDDSTGRAKLTFGSVLFEGVLEVTDADRFRATLAQGIGTGKAYGFGLLSIARESA